MHVDRISQPFAPEGRADFASPTGIEQAILRTVAYADIFDFPVTVEEIVRYLERPSSVKLVGQILAGTSLIPTYLSRRHDYYTLAGRESLVLIRRQRAALADRLWPQAIRFGRLISGLPYVRMVAITGSLAMNNPTDTADVDYLIVSESGRLWTCRAFVIGVVRWATSQGIRLCPNYFLAMDSMKIQEHTLYTAREVAQMIPLAGLEVYQQFRQANAWVDQLLPNAGGRPLRLDLAAGNHRVQPAFEWLLSGAAGLRLEKWEMERKIRKLSRQAGNHSEASFSAGLCKGHYEAHGHHTMDQFMQRTAQHDRRDTLS